MIDHLNPNYADTPGRREPSGFYTRASLQDGNSPDVSIITPYYNTGEFFIETFNSVLAQSFQNWEWIIVDDGSPDESAVERLAKLAQRDGRIKVHRQLNAGTAAARNTGQSHSKGRYLCMLDHDDMLEPTYVEKCIWFLESNSEFAFCSSYNVIFGEQEFLWTQGYERNSEYLKANSAPPIAVIRRSAYEDVGGFDGRINYLYEDWDFWLAMANKGHWGYTIREFLQWYRKLGVGRYEKILETGYDNNKFALEMQKKYPELANRFPNPQRRLLSTYEAIKTDCLLSNPLLPNPKGRRILFILPWMVTGGADRVNLDLIEGLVKQGHEVSVCATLAADHRWESQFSRFTPDIFILPNFLHVSDYPRFLAYIIQSRQIDTAVITGSTLGYQFLPYLRSVSPEVAFLDLCHVEEMHWLNGGHPRFAANYQDLLDLNITTTACLSRWMQNLGADGDRIKIMYTGVRESVPTQENKHHMRDALGLSSDLPVIVFAGRLCEQKRPQLLLEILKRLKENGVEFNAIIIGDGELRETLQNLIVSYQLAACVQLSGFVDHQKWLEILHFCDIFLMPSQYEGISVALLEAIASGVVPVVAKVGGHEEVVNADSGLLISQGADELGEYVRAMTRLLGNRDLRQQMSKQCKSLAASKLSWSGMIDCFSRYLELAHENRRHGRACLVTPRFGREMAVQALENKRLSDAVEWLWNEKPKTLQASLTSESPVSSHEVQAAARFAVAMSQTRFGRFCIRNKFLQALGRAVMKQLRK